MQFQYMALCHYGREVRKHWELAVQKQSAMEAAYSKERKSRRRLESEQAALRSEVESLRTVEARMKKWEARKPAINHYMNAFTEMTK